jgi:PBP1b-binding outer membrane lipoprotein LpoB
MNKNSQKKLAAFRNSVSQPTVQHLSIRNAFSDCSHHLEKMHMIKSLTVLLFGALLLASCGHTNELAHYRVKGASANYRSRVESGAMKSTASISDTSSNPITNIAASIGSDAASRATQQKIASAISSEELAKYFAAGMHQSSKDYLQLKEIPDNGTYIVESILQEFSVNSSSSGVNATVRGTSRIIERATGKIVWEDQETNTVPLRSTPTTGSSLSASLASAFNIAQLADLSVAEIRTVLVNTADEAGKQMAETLREDVAKLK